MSIKKKMAENRLILTEAAVIETLRRMDGVELHPQLAHALLVNDGKGRDVLRQIYSSYIGVARKARVPLMICTPTWRASRDRIKASGIETDINGDAVRLLNELREEKGEFGSDLFIGGLIGCKNDCYRPAECLTSDEAYRFHSWQIERLSAQDADFLMAATLPAVKEAIGIAGSMSDADLPYFISFVINREGRILDGSSLETAIETIDAATPNPPLGYMINCAYPSFLNAEALPAMALERLVGFQGNASSLDHDQLDNSSELLVDPIENWGDLMIDLNVRFGIRILGGCCGTGTGHLEYIVSHFPAGTAIGLPSE